MPNFADLPRLARSWLAGWLALASFALATAGYAQSMIQGNYYWYVPEHEKYAPTVFYGEARFDSRQIRVKSTQRFRLLAGGKGWFAIEFDIAGKAFIHQRLLRSMMYDPGAGEPWGEFQRASVFEEEPAKIEARLQTARTNPQAPVTDSKVPAWKRYKDGWGLRQGRSTPPAASGDATTDAVSTSLPSRPQEKKQKTKYPLLPPIGAEPARPAADPEAGPAPDGTNVPTPQLP